jgi:ferric-dicitrate binding protein FerR (iron transport regulator)
MDGMGRIEQVERQVRFNRMGLRAAMASLAMLAIGVGGNATADDIAGQITASTGLVEGAASGSVAEGDHIKLGEDEGCSILVDQDAVVEMCGDTSVVLRKDKRKRIVELDRGEVRLVVEPRDIEARVEIHTPSAVATLLGTIVHVAVDEKTGKTTISSAESKIAVRSADPGVRGTTVIDTSEQLVVERGQAPPAKPRRLTRDQIAALGGCLVDFHSAALGRDSDEHRERVADRLAWFDGEASDDPGPERVPGDMDRPITSQEGICVTTDCRSGEMMEQSSDPESEGSSSLMNYDR